MRVVQKRVKDYFGHKNHIWYLKYFTIDLAYGMAGVISTA
jgi:hypothetical protein